MRRGPLREGGRHRRAAQADAAHPPGVLVGERRVVEETGQEHRCTGARADVGFEHDPEDARRIPAVDQVEVCGQKRFWVGPLRKDAP